MGSSRMPMARNRWVTAAPFRWAKRGTRPIAARDQRTASTYIFGAVCPKDGKVQP
jgi:hypothetical protein